MRRFFEYPQHMFWLRNEKIIFLLLSCTVYSGDIKKKTLFLRPPDPISEKEITLNN